MVRLTECQNEMLAFIQSLLPGDSSVKDLLQRANLVIWRKRGSFKKGTNFRAWMFSIVRWEVKSYLTERRRTSWLVIDEELTQKITESMSEDGENNSMEDMRAHLDNCLMQLKPDERELVTHRYFSDQLLKDYAETHNRPVNSLKNSLCRIRTTLRRCIESRLVIEQATQH